MNRRDFLRQSGWFVVGAALLPTACGDNDPPFPKGTFQFPQGLASGDPRQNSVVLWSRAVRADGDPTTIEVRVQVSEDDDFDEVVVDQFVNASASADFTMRVLVTDLSPDTTYHYRFIAGGDVVKGRTRTAPEADADVQVNLAWVSCQDYKAGHYHAYAQMIADDEERDEADQIHFVVHLGDVIYETQNEQFQSALDANFEETTLTNADGTARVIADFPSGGGDGELKFAQTVDDYRHLYKTFLSDPDSQAARARWPFIIVWDDHEFSNDCWQSQANYETAGTADEGSQTRKLAANQAWFEYTPAQLSGAGGVNGVTPEAHDFEAAAVVDAEFTAPNEDNFVDEPNNVAAVESITIYRSFRFGKHVELVMTDQRSYRSDHAIPEDFITGGPLSGIFFDPRNALPLPLVNMMDAGSDGPASVTITVPNPGPGPAMVDVQVPNLRAALPPGTMLGTAQKAWWKATMKNSDATWKLWGNEVPLMRMSLGPAVGPGAGLITERIVDGDGWDGYASERNELMTFIRDEEINNVVVLTGDIHASFAGVVMHNYDVPVANRDPVAVEIIGPGVSSNSLFSFYEFASRSISGLRDPVSVDESARGGAKFTETLNLTLSYNVVAGGAFGAVHDVAQAKGLADGVLQAQIISNPHLKYVDTNANGYAYAKVTADQVEATVVVIERPVGDAADPSVLRTTTLTVPKDNPAGLSNPVFTGTPPFGAA